MQQLLNELQQMQKLFIQYFEQLFSQLQQKQKLLIQ